MIGRTIKRIRKNKGYTQASIAQSFLSQSAYSKFEAELSDISANSYIQLLENLHLTLDEVIYINNDYKYNNKQELTNRFFSLPHNKAMELQQLLSELQTYLLDNNDSVLSELKIICEALLLIFESKNIALAQETVKPVWERLSKYDQWYLSDIRIMNVILFIFPTEVAIELTKKVLTRLELYNGFLDSSKLGLTFRINLSLLLIKSECYSEALELLTTALEENRQIMPYQTLAVCFARMAICYFKLEQGMEMEFLHKAQQLLQLYEDQNLWSNIQDEYYRYCNKDS